MTPQPSSRPGPGEGWPTQAALAGQGEMQPPLPPPFPTCAEAGGARPHPQLLCLLSLQTTALILSPFYHDLLLTLGIEGGEEESPAVSPLFPFVLFLSLGAPPPPRCLS